MAATAGLRATRLALSQQWLFLGAMRAIHRAEEAGSQAGQARPRFTVDSD
jgi:phosphoenolpyruvate-protein kinase (PTS system EI component)